MFHELRAIRRVAAARVPRFEMPWQDTSDGSRTLVALAALVAVALLALLIAAAAHRRRLRSHRRGRVNDATPLAFRDPLAPADSMESMTTREIAPEAVYDTPRLPRWVQAGSIIVALGITWTVGQRLRPRGDRTTAEVERGTSSIATVDSTTPEPATGSGVPFAFRAHAWTADGTGCRSALEVTEGSSAPHELTLDVHDSDGRLLGRATAQVAVLRAGETVSFRLPDVPCNRIAAWEVRGRQSTAR